MTDIPLPLLLVPWLGAIVIWIAFPWLSRRAGRPDLLRWLPPGLVVVGGALLWLSAAGAPADGYDARGLRFATASDALCDASGALPGDRDAAIRAFQDRAHQALHELAAGPALDRALAGDLLRAKQAVEAVVAEGAPGAELDAPMEALLASTERALTAIGVEVEPCAG